MAMTQSRVPEPPTRLEVELLALDLAACSRCTGARANLRAALALASELLREVGTEVVYKETVVSTAEEAERLRFASSPSVRINGRDIAAEFRESTCADCGELCGCGGGVDCRVWVWRGKEHLEAPRALFLDALLNAYAQSGHPTEAASTAFRLPENLRTFFVSLEKRKKQDATCCDESTCCEPADKAACCGNNAEDSSAKSPACGCR
jgi:hypothetical protein